MKTYILAAHCNNLNYIEFQYKSLKKYFKGDYEYIVINDAKDIGDNSNFNQYNMKEKIENKCNELGIKCINLPQHLHNNRNILFPNTTEHNTDNPSARNAITIQYGFNMYCNIEDGYLIVIDSDMFFYNDFNINDIMDGYDIAGCKQCKKNEDNSVEYLWIALCIFNLKTCKNLNEFYWDCGKVHDINVDAGGQSYHYIQKYNPKINYLHWNHYENMMSYKNEELEPKVVDFLNEICKITHDNKCSKEVFKKLNLIHLRCGSNWDYKGISYHMKQYDLVNKIFFG
jgi:hypothetical protein